MYDRQSELTFAQQVKLLPTNKKMKIKKNVFPKLLSTIAILLFISCSNTKTSKEPKIKSERVTRYYYKMGVIDTTATDTPEVTNYNQFGKPTEEITGYSKTIYLYEFDTLLTSKTVYRKKDNKINYKKNITYNKEGKKLEKKIYATFAEQYRPEIIASMQFFYDTKNRICLQKYFGNEIDYNEIEDIMPIATPSVIEDRERERQQINHTAKYVYNENNKKDIVYLNVLGGHHIIFSDATLNYCDSSYIKFNYNSKGNLISEIPNPERFGIDSVVTEEWGSPNNDGKYYFYKNNKLSKIKINKAPLIILKTFNENENVIEVKWCNTLRKKIFRDKLNYYENGLVKEVIHFNEIEEPESVEKYEYELY